MTRLWDRGTSLDDTIERFTIGRDPELDQHLLAYDALASAAHATMLGKIGVLDESERDALLGELALIAKLAQKGEFAIAFADEDGHTAIENHLTQRLGDAGRKIHTGRSRNDQVIAAVRLYARDALLMAHQRVTKLAEKLAKLAKEHAETTVAGYTHTRQAMPSTYGLLFGAHAEGLADALPWIERAFLHVNRSPLGSASGYGVALDLDRELTAELLAFEGVQRNTLAVQNDRGKSEALALGAVVMPAIDLGRLATDLIFFSADELRFITLSPEVTTGSSIMPQKRNPDVLELVRATASRLRARQAEIISVYASLPSGYQRDLQLTKEPFLEGMQQANALFLAMGAALDGITIDRERSRQALATATGATDEVYRRVREGEPFRSAYKKVAGDPEAAVKDDLREAWKTRTHLGAPGKLDLAPVDEALASAKAFFQDRKARCDAAWSLLPSNGE
jgi:argininosuccinate lyase